MKHASKPQFLSFGELIASIFGACDRRRAIGLLRLAVNAGLVVLPGRRRVAIPTACQQR